jgi:hypothetical protein
MRVLHGERLQFLVPAQEAEVMPLEVADLGPEPLDLRP